jgi:hypothetical protein
MNLTDLTKEDVALVLDGLASLPLARSYNLFNKIAQQAGAQGMQIGQQPPAAPASSQVQ